MPAKVLLSLILAVVAAGCSSDSGDAVIDIEFNGSECSVDPVSVEAGDWAFVVTNTSDYELEAKDLFVNRLPDGYAFEDVVALQTAVGGPPNVVPDSEWSVVYDAGVEPVSFSSPPGLELDDNQFLQMRTLSAGDDFVELYIYEPPLDVQWICQPPINVSAAND